MKFLVFLLAISVHSFAQDSSKPAPINYKTYASFPAYPLYALDSSRFNSISVPVKNQPVVIIYFSPTCSHCQHQAEEITSHIKDFRDVKFLMVSSYPMPEIKQFAETYGIGHFTNITLAHDPTFAMGQFFELHSLPGIFLYDKKGHLKKTFETNQKAEALLQAIQQ